MKADELMSWQNNATDKLGPVIDSHFHWLKTTTITNEANEYTITNMEICIYK